MQDIIDLPDDYIDKIYIEIGENVKKIRMEKGISQLKLAQAIGHKSLSIVSLAEIYYNKQHFNIEHLVKIAYVLDVNICDFFPKEVLSLTTTLSQTDEQRAKKQ